VIAAPPAIELSGVGVWRAQPGGGRVRLLTGVDWVVRPGERWAVVGPNGAGKSTLLALVAAAAFPSEGRATVLGRRLGSTDMRALREDIGLVDAAAAGAFARALTAREVVMTGITGSIALRVDAAASSHHRAADELLDLLGVARVAGRRFRLLSRGERQRVLLARAAVAQPRLLLLDEPTEGLDLVGRELFLAALDTLSQSRPDLACVQVSHHLEDLAPGTGHAMLLREGAVVAAGPVGDALTERTMSVCFGAPVRVSRVDGRMLATIGRTRHGGGVGEWISAT
jgi:iron complex transport system ATP-binding protein